MTIPSTEHTHRSHSRRGFAQTTLIATVAALLLSLTVALVTVSIGIARADPLAPSACGRDMAAASLA